VPWATEGRSGVRRRVRDRCRDPAFQGTDTRDGSILGRPCTRGDRGRGARGAGAGPGEAAGARWRCPRQRATRGPGRDARHSRAGHMRWTWPTADCSDRPPEPLWAERRRRARVASPTADPATWAAGGGSPGVCLRDDREHARHQDQHRRHGPFRDARSRRRGCRIWLPPTQKSPAGPGQTGLIRSRNLAGEEGFEPSIS
jgi:hypothetical protein